MGEHLIFLNDQKEELLALWDAYHCDYTNVISEYVSLMEEKKRLGIRLLRTISKTELKEYPDIPFLRAKDRDEALCQLVMMSDGETKYVKNAILNLTGNLSSIYHRLKKANKSSKLQIQMAGNPKTYVSFGRHSQN